MILAQQSVDLSPFQDDDIMSSIIDYRSQREADTFFRQTCAYDHGLGLFHGPRLSGKMTAIRRFVEKMPEDSAAGIVDGAKQDVPSFLLAIAQSFGFDLESASTNVLINLIKVFAVQQTASNIAPLLVIQNLNKMTPETLHIVCQLAQLKTHNQSALRLILVSDSPLDRMVSAPELGAIRSRQTGEHELGPMTRAETAYFIDAKLRHAGVKRPETVLPAKATDELHNESGGRPGLLNQCVVRRLTEADDEPSLVLTRFGETLATFALSKKRILIGRSDSNDVVIDSTFVSRHHIMLARENDKTVLTDLNSTNGTFVNSKRVSICGMRHDDVISFGDFRIKLLDPLGVPRAEVDESSLADTVTMKALNDIRRRNARDNIQVQQAMRS